MSLILECHKIDKINFIRGENCYLFDDAGNKYLDLIAGCWSTALGYCHPRINQVIKSQVDKTMHLGWRYPNQIVEDASFEVLKALGIKDGKCVFLSSGSEAVELGIKILKHIKKEYKLLKFSSSYLSAFNKPDADWIQIDWSLIAEKKPIDYLNDLSFENIGGFIFEPGGSGSEAVKFAPIRLVQDIAEKIKDNDGLILANEITTGFGRTGKWFGFQNYDLQPDIIAVGKCLGNGYPVSAVAMTKAVADMIEVSDFHHVQSHQNDPLGCAVAKEVITVLRNEDWISKGNRTGAYFLDGLKRIKEKHNIVKEARGKGMLMAFELFPYEDFTIEMLYDELFKNGYIVLYSADRNFLRFDPALTIEKSDIDRFLECLDSVLIEFDKKTCYNTRS